MRSFVLCQCFHRPFALHSSQTSVPTNQAPISVLLARNIKPSSTALAFRPHFPVAATASGNTPPKNLMLFHHNTILQLN